MATTVTDNPAADRYEARMDGELAGTAAYRLAGETTVLTHTEVDPAYEGRGVGSALAAGALDDLRRRGRLAQPDGPFIHGYIGHHPEYQDLVAAG